MAEDKDLVRIEGDIRDASSFSNLFQTLRMETIDLIEKIEGIRDAAETIQKKEAKEIKMAIAIDQDLKNSIINLTKDTELKRKVLTLLIKEIMERNK